MWSVLQKINCHLIGLQHPQTAPGETGLSMKICVGEVLFHVYETYWAYECGWVICDPCYRVKVRSSVDYLFINKQAATKLAPLKKPYFWKPWEISVIICEQSIRHFWDLISSPGFEPTFVLPLCDCRNHLTKNTHFHDNYSSCMTRSK